MRFWHTLLSACHRVQEEYEAEIARYGDCGDGDEGEGFSRDYGQPDGLVCGRSRARRHQPNDYIRSLDDTAELLELFAVLSGTGIEPMPDFKDSLGRDHTGATAGLRRFVIKAIEERDVLRTKVLRTHSALEILAEWEDEDLLGCSPPLKAFLL